MDVGKCLNDWAIRKPNKIALIFEDRQVTYAETRRLSDNLARGISALGISKGDPVAIFLPNCLEYAIAYYAIMKLGGICAPLDVRLKKEELITIFTDAQMKAVITTSDFVPLFQTVKSKIPSLECIVSLGGGTGEGVTGMEALLNQDGAELPAPEVSSDDVALYLYTSGTTGKPKGVMTTCGNLDRFPADVKEVWKTGEQDRWLLCLPASHISGPIIFNLPISIGTTAVILSSFHPKKWMETVQNTKVTMTHLVPPIAIALLQLNEFDKYDLSSLKGVALMGACSAQQLVHDFGYALGLNRPVWQGYGLTETSPLITLEPIQDSKGKTGTIGLPVPGIEVKIVDENGNEVPTDNIGEIITRGPHIMEGYHNNPEATNERIRDGWLHTGDLARMDENGYIYIVGRMSDRINVGGLMVYISEVEDVVHNHPKIKEYAVVGVPDEKRGEQIKAVVVLKDNEKADAQEIIDFCRKHLAQFKVPKIVEFRDSLPKTGAGKIAKEQLEKPVMFENK